MKNKYIKFLLSLLLVLSSITIVPILANDENSIGDKNADVSEIKSEETKEVAQKESLEDKSDDQEKKSEEIGLEDSKDEVVQDEIIESDSRLEEPVILSSNDYYQNDGNLELTIFDYNPDTKWTLGNLKIVNVKMDYGNATEVGKQLSITLPVGMKFNSYDVVQNPSGSYEELMVESNRVFFESSISPTYQSLYGSVNGTLTYNIKPNTTKVDISFVISIDDRLWIKPDVIEDAIVIEASENGSIKNALNIDINGYSNNYAQLYNGNTGTATTTLNSNYHLLFNSLLRNGSNRNDTMFWKKQIIKFYYPVGGSFQNLKYANGVIVSQNGIGVTSIIDDSDNGVVTLTFENVYTQGNIYAEISTGSLSVGVYPITSTSIEYETMMEETGKVTANNPGVLNIVDEIENKLSLITGKRDYYDVLGNDYYSPNALVSVRNTTNSIKTNQWFKAEFGEGYEVIQFTLPDYYTPTEWNDKVVRYTTNKKSTWQYVPNNLKFINANINRANLNLESDEYFKIIEIEFGDVPENFISNVSKGVAEGSTNYYHRMKFPGKLSLGYNSANVTYSVFEKENDVINEDTLSESTQTIHRNSGKAYASLGALMNNIEFSAGTKKNVIVQLGDTNSYIYTQLNATKNPSLYIKLPDDVYIDKNSVTAKINTTTLDSSNVIVSDEYVVTNSNGVTSRVVRIDIIGEIGDYFGKNYLEPYNLDISLDIIASSSAQVTDRTSNIFFWASEYQTLSNIFGGVSPIKDSYNLTNKNDENITLLPVQNKSFTVLPKSEVVVDTYITPSGGTRQNPYDVDDPSTAINFTPGTTAEYTVEVLNNTSSAVNEFYAFIPVPKTGNDFGTNFQTTAFNWDMKLKSTPQIKIYNASGEDVTAEEINNYIIEYSSDATNSSNYETATYSNIYSENTSMIKVSSVSGEIEPGFKAVLMFYYEVDETPTSAVNKIGTINDFRPYYYYDAGNAGFLQGTLVGAALEIGEVAGIVFEDKDLDGIYGPGDELLANKTVTLQERVSTNPDVFTTIDSTTTDVNGKYAFEGLSNGYMRIVVSKDAGEEFTPLPVSNSINRSMVNLQGESSVVESASLEASHVNAGIIKYQASDLTVNINENFNTLLVGDEISLTTTITPTFFDKIKASTDAIVWSTSNSSVASVDQNGQVVAISSGTVTITITIKDIYGNEATDSITFEAYTDTDPELVVQSELNWEINASGFDPRDYILIASDVEDTDLGIDDVVYTQGPYPTHTLGEFTINYSLTDSDDNTTHAQMVVHVVDTIAPVITVEHDTITLNTNTNEYKNLTQDSLMEMIGITVTDNSLETITPTTNYDSLLPLTPLGEPGKSYTLIISATDSSGNTGSKEVTIVVVDNTPPTLVVRDVTYEKDSTITEATFLKDTLVSVSDDYSSRENITITSDFDTVVNLTQAGEYTVNVKATDEFGNETTETLTVYIITNTYPELEVEETIEWEINTPGFDPKDYILTASDVEDTDLGIDDVVYTQGPYPTDTLGYFTIDYSLTDSDNNTTHAQMIVHVVDTIAPVITVERDTITLNTNTNEYMNLTQESLMEMIGITVTDNSLETITPTTNYDSLLPLTPLGEPGKSYTLIISATDSSGNTGTKEVTIIVVDNTPPTLVVRDVTYEKDSTITEATFLKDTLVSVSDDYSSRENITITSDFDTVVNLTQVGEYTVSVKAADEFGNETTQTVKVIIKQVEETEETEKETSDKDKLPSTGISSNNTFYVLLLVSIGSSLILKRKKQKH